MCGLDYLFWVSEDDHGWKGGGGGLLLLYILSCYQIPVPVRLLSCSSLWWFLKVNVSGVPRSLTFTQIPLFSTAGGCNRAWYGVSAAWWACAAYLVIFAWGGAALDEITRTPLSKFFVFVKSSGSIKLVFISFSLAQKKISTKLSVY